MAIYDDTITENLQTTDAWLLGVFGLITENIDMQEGLVSQALVFIREQIAAQDLMFPSCVFNKEIIDNIQLEEFFRLLFPVVISDLVTCNDNPIEVAVRIADIIESFRPDDSVSTQATFNSALVMAMVMADIANKALSVSVLELIDVQESLVDLFLTSAIIVDQIEATLVGQEFLVLGALIEESLGLDDTISLQSILNSEVLDQIEFVGALQTGEFYNTFSFNPEGYALTTYSNFNFNSIAEFNGTYILANSTGLYEFGGTTDNLTEIVARIKTSAMDFGSTSRKQVKKMYLGLTNDGNLVLKVSTDGKGEFFYILESRTEGLDTQAIKVGKGLVGRYWQFTLITTENSSLDIDSMEFLPVEFRRKI
jgi:hypothetical protein